MRSDTPTSVAVDTGGTFTDFVVLRDGVRTVYKRASTPDDPARAVLDGLAELLEEGEVFVLAHGSTVATNALLERRGARTAWITNRGFEDLIEIGRQARPSSQLYALVAERPSPLVAPEARFGVSGRMLKDGSEESGIEPAEIEGLLDRLGDFESVAVGFLHSYANPEHEEALGAALAELDVPVTLSARLLPEYREYERFSTALVNAYVAPLVQRYLQRLDAAAGAERVRIMASGGGAFSVERAAREPVHTVLSGPAGGVVAALEATRRSGFDAALSFDMGGTSTDVSLCPGRPLTTREYEISGCAVAIPVIDIHTVGAGGGSIARRDPGGALKVGPASAGAVPGPICYGAGGTELTVTDAHVWLGRIAPDLFLGGAQRLDRDAIAGPLERLADELAASPEETAEGVLEVADTRMEGALRLISLERGHDPADLTLVAFGGAAPLHAARLAGRLGVSRVLVPPDPGTLSAHGILVADVRKDTSRSVLATDSDADLATLEPVFDELEAQARGELELDGFAGDDVVIDRGIDARYVGQSYELGVPATADWVEAFHSAHQQRFGFRRDDAPVEAVTVRVTARAPVRRPAKPELAAATDPPEVAGPSQVYFDGGWRRVPLHRREDLLAGHELEGPAIVAEYSSTTWLAVGWRLRVLAAGDLLLSR
ncbi:MAG: hydantoinase/oxoprolinase family protein [Gemmatimonadetes bacterium]|uniref:Hydantoinase/oxoprolinase family protein n=1 Tax=Candidatus Kutchimonas denitrificans TaxID=3056748 RepID=A0AAE4ZAF5_9BACT|nr:hydantoinase/oxoprolinase family protein [Gemmatimonadota bacterium]NIR76279.1 hydantoinase/oxoprolinase family protein [Candidatus Kutchimonas denitrificans]NIS02302.1 hydantoinase/oxoprolinase family protein [Gemmatimonadota bacterium]NIT68121.1 hydantoinase/oxoprolinase family protein [Gemmatimonadota bacterium]NIU54345.1 hydantoinase/oxoprolinase family protein [Gemmatimonadota bacterium]